jgi:hypothetical protein
MAIDPHLMFKPRRRFSSSALRAEVDSGQWTVNSGFSRPSDGGDFLEGGTVNSGGVQAVGLKWTVDNGRRMGSALRAEVDSGQ